MYCYNGKDSAEAARSIAREALRVRETRTLVLRLLEEGIQAAQDANPWAWATKLGSGKGLRLSVGSADLFELHTNGVLQVSVHREVADLLRVSGVPGLEVGISGADEAMPDAVSARSAPEALETAVPLLKPGFLRMVAAAATATTRYAGQEPHCSGVVKYLQRELGVNVPSPRHADSANRWREPASLRPPGYLLKWDPEREPWPEASQTMQSVRGGSLVEKTWASGDRYFIPEGARVFLLRAGATRRGIFAAGRVSGVVSASSGQKAPRVPIEFDALVNPHSADLLPLEALSAGQVSEMQWNSSDSCIEVVADALDELEKRWAAHLEALGYWTPLLADAQRRALQTVHRKLRDASFARRIRANSGGRCAVCPETISYGDSGILQAAHIRAVADDGVDDASNALALCPTHHALFDAGLWTIEGDRVCLSSALDESLHNTFSRIVSCPWGLGPTNLEWHRSQCFRK